MGRLKWRVHALLPKISSDSRFGVGQGSLKVPGHFGDHRGGSVPYAVRLNPSPGQLDALLRRSAKDS